MPLPLFDPSQVAAVKIDEKWWGLSPDAPIVSQIMIAVSADASVGDAFYSKGSGSPVSTTVPVTVTTSEMMKALEALSQTPVEAGTYRPFINHTDDYPQIRIELMLPDGNVVFETRSQDQDNLPWQVLLEGKAYVTFSDLPSTAVKLLDPFLAREEQRKL